MTVILNKPYWDQVWKGEISGADPMENAKNVVAHFNTSKAKGCDAMVLTCKVDELKAPVMLTMAHNYSRLFSDDLTLSGVVGAETSKGKKQFYHIKINCDDSEVAYPLGVCVLLALNLIKQIQHSRALIVQKATETTPKRKITLGIDFVDGNPELGIDSLVMLENTSHQ